MSIYDTVTFTPLRTLLTTHMDTVTRLVIEASAVFTSSFDGSVHRYARDDEGLQEMVYTFGVSVSGLAVDSRFVYGGTDGVSDNLVAFHRDNATQAHGFVGHEDHVRALVLRQNRLYSASLDYAIREWDASNGTALRAILCSCAAGVQTAQAAVWDLVVYLDTLLVAGDYAITVLQYNLTTMSPFPVRGYGYTALTPRWLSLRGSTLFATGGDRVVFEWDLARPTAPVTQPYPNLVYDQHTDDVVALEVIASLDVVVTGSNDDTVHIVGATNLSLIRSMFHPGDVYALAASGRETRVCPSDV